MSSPYPYDPPSGWQNSQGSAYGPGAYGQPAGYGPGQFYAPPPYYPPPQRKSRAWLWIVGVVGMLAVVAIAITAVVLVMRKPDITALTAAVTVPQSSFPSVRGGDFSTEPVDDSPAYEPMNVTPTECRYVISYPKAQQTVSARLTAGATIVAIYLQIDSVRPDLKSALTTCEGKTLSSGDSTYEVSALNVSGVPSWAFAETLAYHNSDSSGSNYVIGGYHRGVYVEAWSSAATTDVGTGEVVALFNAQVDRLDRQ